MATGTIIMIVCALLLLLLGFFSQKDLDGKDHQNSVTDDPAAGWDFRGGGNEH